MPFGWMDINEKQPPETNDVILTWEPPYEGCTFHEGVNACKAWKVGENVKSWTYVPGEKATI